VHVGGLDWGDDGAAVVGGGDLCPSLKVSFQPVCEFHPSSQSRSCSEDVVQFAEVVTSRRDGEVEVRCLPGEYYELSGW
jgi:hypothetical protein